MGRLHLTRQQKTWLLTAVAVVVVVGVIVLVHGLNKSNVATTVTPNPSPSATNKGTGNSGSNSATPTPSSTAGGGTGNSGNGTAPVQSPGQTPTPAMAPPVPTGDLLNVHTVSASGTTKLESTCQTFPGYKCSVQATNNSTGKVAVVGSVTADGNGTAIIDWSGKDIGTGTWTIRLLALNGALSTQSTLYDTLEVTP